MYQIGLKLWSTNTDHYLREAKRLYGDHVFSYIELYIVPDTLDKLPLWKATGIPFILHNAHFMQGFNLAKKECEKRNYDIYRQTKQYADELNARYIIFHGGTNGNIEETARQLEKYNDPRALIENKPYCAMINNGNRCVGYSPEEISYVKSRVNCGFCLDIGHAFAAANYIKVSPTDYVKSFLRLSPAMYHLSDNDSDSHFDKHYHLGKGNFDFPAILSLLDKSAVITLETDKDSAFTLDDFYQDCRVLNEY